jgi:acyl dehydratase
MYHPMLVPVAMIALPKVPWPEPVPAPETLNVVMVCADNGTEIASAANTVIAVNNVKVLDFMKSPF